MEVNQEVEMTEPEGNVAKEARRLSKQGQHHEAIALLRSSYVSFAAPHLYVLEGQILQLSDGSGEDELGDVENAFKRALAIDDTCVEAYLELGWFYLNVRDDAGKAEGCFQKAEELSRSQLLEALEGKLKCLAETGTLSAAKSLLRQLQESVLSTDELLRLARAIKE